MRSALRRFCTRAETGVAIAKFPHLDRYMYQRNTRKRYMQQKGGQGLGDHLIIQLPSRSFE
jgi:hypothetical protein